MSDTPNGLEAKVTIVVEWQDGRKAVTSDYIFEETPSEDFSDSISCQILHAIENGRRQKARHEWCEAQRLDSTYNDL